MPALYHFWSAPEAQRIRLALAYKDVAFDDHPLDYDDDETFYELGVQRVVPVLRLDDGSLLTDSLDILWRIDALFPGTPELVAGRIDRGTWDALLEWRTRAHAVFARLYAAARPAYRDIGKREETLSAYKAEVRHRFGMTVEELANDRYAGFEQMDRLTRLGELARHLARNRFYTGVISIADMVLAADFHPQQVLDGVSLPIDLMYYLSRVKASCSISLGEGLIAPT